MSNFVVRGITGLVFVSFIVCATIFGDWYFQVLFGVVGIFSLHEFYGLFKKSETFPNTSQGLIVGVLFYTLGLYAIHQQEWNPSLIGLIILFFPIAGLAELYRDKKTPFQNMGITILGVIYIMVPFLLINLMRLGTDNYWPVLSIFILTWSSDTFAYLVGRKIGKHKLFERISPRKSWEGFVGGVIFSVIAGLLIAYFTGDNLIKYGIYGLTIASLGTLGDLLESMLKRSKNLKDSGNILPGHGGLLDRFDSVIFVIPFIYFLETYIFI